MFVHETTYAYQFETGDIVHFNDGSGSIADLGDEVEAFKSQYLFDPTNRQFAEISGAQDITPDVIKHIKKYTDFPSANFNIQSTILDLVKANLLAKKDAESSSTSMNTK